ncbi:PREDICTED: carbon catabolite repressor protein 4 homolog 6 isoform X2 [Theobroma cacao]|uniref:Carbon catabolite repressor protein 4 homolog 6 isoform X2 n=1 Tax=Theobroma cacao TaxID=3641 RepID=A0AB32WUB3_THECC|nr:PREDICTED: carbon catabolite repressor protein 4 homolog 6 isoform X2 [Theobroma cacao]
MWRPSFSLRPNILAASAIADPAVMSSSRRPYRGRRNQWCRGFSDRSNSGGRGQLVTGDSHLNSVREANLGFRRGNFSNQNSFQPQQFGYRPRPQSPYDQNQQQFRQPPPSHPYNRYQRPRQSFDQNQAARPFRPRNSKPWDYREWEYAKTPPPSHSERFIVLSYNILADYLASTHRNLYFHIPLHMMNWEWRKRNLMFELGLWSADIMCFQEVDKFHDLEEQMKYRGYSGIWKMRTGNAMDGCAIFWRTSRFKLLHEEYIEFNKHGLRDNVAQICVLELLSQHTPENTSAPLKSSANKVVVCNIHVLYNPRRGEIKLGQVRRLLEGAHSVSKSWDDAPVVLCGDFNCTPKSPLYNFISEQKLDLSGVDRDKVSGQASAEIPPPMPYNPNSGVQSCDNSVQVPSTVDIKEVGVDKNDSHSDTQKQNNLDRNIKDAPINNLPRFSETMQDFSDMSCNNLLTDGNGSAQYGEVTTRTHQNVIDVAKAETGSTFFIPIDNSKKSSSCCHNEVKFPIDEMDDDKQRFSLANSSCIENVCSDVTEMEHTGIDITIHSNEDTCIVMDDHSNRVRTDPEFLNTSKSTGSLCQTHSPDSVVVSHLGISGSRSSQSIANDDSVSPSIPYQVDFSGLSAGIDIEVEEKMDNLSLEELSKAMVEGGTIVEDNNAFVAALYGNEDVNPTNSGLSVSSDLDHSSKEFFSSQNSQFLLPSDEMLDDLSPSLDSEGSEVEQATYDPSVWSPMEIATATGSEDCNFLEHPLQLKSTYTEVKDFSGTRDLDGEPLVTSYNRRFFGTVDYIWRSEGLQTARVLAPIPKHAMQWTPGFPTKGCPCCFSAASLRNWISLVGLHFWVSRQGRAEPSADGFCFIHL